VTLSDPWHNTEGEKGNLFQESNRGGATVMLGAPLLVDFGKDMKVRRGPA
jgi:hypothetical protein